MLQGRVVRKSFLDGSEEPEGFDVNFVPACIKQAKGRDRKKDDDQQKVNNLWKPIDFEPVIKEEPDFRARRSTIKVTARNLLEQKTAAEKVETVKRLGFSVFGISPNSIDEDNMSIDNGRKPNMFECPGEDLSQVTYFEPPETRARAGLLQAFLRPSDLIEQSAASVFLADPQKAVQQDTWVLSPNPCLAPGIMDTSGFNHIAELDCDDGGILEEPQDGKMPMVTMFGEFFAAEDIGLHRSLSSGREKNRKVG